LAQRKWTVMQDPETGELDRDQVARILVDLEPIGHHLGGVFTLAPVRRAVADGAYETIGWVFGWHSTAPAVSAPRQEPEEQGAARSD